MAAITGSSRRWSADADDVDVATPDAVTRRRPTPIAANNYFAPTPGRA